jgi:membrane protein YqaA with SNARE-associated domain
LKLKKIDFVFIILLIILTIIAIDLLLNESHRELIENISDYPPFQNLGSGLLITFWVCMIGNLLPVPTPYTFVVCLTSEPFRQINIFVPLLVGFIASLGCLVGEMGGYLVGRGAAEVISVERKANLNKYQHYLLEHPKLAPFLIDMAWKTRINADFCL